MEVKLIVNVGLNTASGGEITAEFVRQTFASNGAFTAVETVVQSDTEPTWVAAVVFRINKYFVPQALYAIAEELDQDCIAVYSELKGVGALIGPLAVEWGEFNPEYFFRLDGTRLGQHSQAA